MKSLKIGKVISTIKRKNTLGPEDTSPEAIASRSVRSFCESTRSDDEVIYLPPIVENAESSPSAAKQCADIIRDYLKKDYYVKPDIQFNALMLVRILSENPGFTFTQNIDQEFVKTAKDLLRNGKTTRVTQMLMETLEWLESTKYYDEGVTPLIEMWKKEKEKSAKATSGAPVQSYLQQQQRSRQQPPPPQANHIPHLMTAPPVDPHSQNYYAQSQSRSRLPDPIELANRLEEARTSANLLQQVLANTSPTEVLTDDLIKEFADRCKTASRSIQGYMSLEDPAPDNDTMESLIDTNEHLQAALNLHQRAMLNARKLVESTAADESDLLAIQELQISELAESSRQPSPLGAGLGISTASGSGSRGSPTTPPRETNGKGKEREYQPSFAESSAGPSRSRTPPEEDPFRDPDEQTGSGSRSRWADSEPRLFYEPFHPGFGHSSYASGAIDKETTKIVHGAVEIDSSSYRAGNGNGDVMVEISDDDSLYDPPPKQKEPIYRY